MNGIEIIVLTPPGMTDASLAIAACRAGALGVLDLEYLRPDAVAAAREAAQSLDRLGGGQFGLKFSLDNVSLFQEIAGEGLPHLRAVILTGADFTSARVPVDHFRSRGLRVILECLVPAHADQAETLKVDGVIAKGEEAGGRVGRESTFVLLQRLLHRNVPAVYAQGGIGLHTAAAGCAGGAAGVVLDSQLWLTRESPLPPSCRKMIAAFDGSETTVIGDDLGAPFRICSRTGQAAVKFIQERERALVAEAGGAEKRMAAWHCAVAGRMGWRDTENEFFFAGQDMGGAALLARKHVTVAGVIQAVRRAVSGHIAVARKEKPLGEGALLALSHRTRYPIVQGPMAHISDNADFAYAVASEGALPFLALSYMEEAALFPLLEKVRARLGDLPWGVGLLGFLPPALYEEQVKTVIACRPGFALLAGGRPHQVKVLEAAGIPTYVHAPSPGLLKGLIENGARRFVFEGRESGGHVGPTGSFALWDRLIDGLLAAMTGRMDGGEFHVLFAGGIHDDLSAAMVATAAAPLVERGVRIGVQVGSAYLFTREAVSTGAITPAYQQAVLDCRETLVLECGGGHANRCLENPFARTFLEERRRLLAADTPPDRLRDLLDRLCQGKLRIAAKGTPSSPDAARDDGLFLIGQNAALRDAPLALGELHQEICAGDRLKRAAGRHLGGEAAAPPAVRPLNIAIVGIACIFPKAPDLPTYWHNILGRVNAIGEVPPDRWDADRFYSTDRRAQDKVYSRHGAFIDDILFDPIRYGIPPRSLPSIEPLQLLTLEAARRALEDAGYAERAFPRERTSVVIGMSGVSDLSARYSFRASLPLFFDEATCELITSRGGPFPEWTEDSFPGILLNVTAGRIANRFDLGGTNFIVDGACASSLAAVHAAVRELETGACDMVLAGGADAMQNPFTYQCFAKTQALSPRAKCSPLDENADGIIIGEGVAVLVLKRLADAERDGDRIYAVIQGVGAASDGRDKSLTAPRLQGQLTALTRAYAAAGISPTTVALIEAHATGTAVGDRTELEALSRLFTESGANAGQCAVGSVKSMIGHTKSAAGLASLIKTALALYHKVLPPTIEVEKPHPVIRHDGAPLYVNTELRPWLRGEADHPRRAGVSAFGFGGTNFHVVLEEYGREYLGHLKSAPVERPPAELFLFAGPGREALAAELLKVREGLAGGASPSPAELAAACCARYERRRAAGPAPGSPLALVAESLDDLGEKLDRALELLGSGEETLQDPRGIYFTAAPLGPGHQVAFLFPGQGSQRVNMLSDLAIQFPEVREMLEQGDRVLAGKYDGPLSAAIFPPPAFDEAETKAREKRLADTRLAQPAMGVAGLAMYRLLASFGLVPDMAAGHSYGEYVALCAAGVFQPDDLIALSEARARFIQEGAGPAPGIMAAVRAGVEATAAVLKDRQGIWIANLNAPRQTVVAGGEAEVEAAVQAFKAQGIQARQIRVSCAFHSPLIAGGAPALEAYLRSLSLSAPRFPVYSNLDRAVHPADADAVVDRLVRHMTGRVDFVGEIEAMYRDGARIFVEAGPGRVLTGLVDQILDGRPHLALPSHLPGDSGLARLCHLLAVLAVHGVPLKLERLYVGRGGWTERLEDLLRPASPTPSAGLWRVNGARAVPAADPAPVRPGVTLSLAPADSGSDRLPPSGRGADPGEERAFPALSPPAGLPAGEGEAETVMVRYQHLMRRFLETEQTVMAHYLGLPPAEKPSAAIGRESLCDVPADAPVPPPPMDSEAAAPPAPEALPATGRDLAARLLEVVSGRTGYPMEMLDLDVDLESDLGIDSIKRVEILEEFLASIAGDAREGVADALEDLNRLKTLRAILGQVEKDGRFAASGEGTAGSRALAPLAAQTDPPGQAATPCPRWVPIPVDAPLPAEVRPPAPDRFLLLTDDGRGIARALAEKLASRGIPVARVGCGEGTDPEAYQLADDSAAGVAALVQTIKKRLGACGGFIHLLPLGAWPAYRSCSLGDWQARLAMELKTLLHFLQALAKDLRDAPSPGRHPVLAATAMGGAFGLDGPVDPDRFFPGHGGVTGLVKTVAVEWPEVRARTVDLDLEAPAAALADQLLEELQADDRPAEVGRLKGRRVTIGQRAAGLSPAAEASLRIDADAVILVTGGARGITAAAAAELARRYRPTLILAGRSPLPPPGEDAETAGITDDHALKSALIRQMKAAGHDLKLAEVEKAFRRLQKEREIRANLQALERLGARAEYHPVDVRDEAAFGALIDGIYQRHGRLDGVIHGAGIIEDRLVQDKEWDSFRRVLGTKAESAFVLSRRLRPETLRFVIFFSSVAGRFGNRGQGDYAAANEVLNKLALYLKASWPARVVSINWGPWATTGMVSPEIQRQFAERGIGLVPVDTGVGMLSDEIVRGGGDGAEIVIGEVGGFQGVNGSPELN